MNILIIGNGFDLAHGLPTSYDNFLDFCDIIKYIFDKKINLYQGNMNKINNIMSKRKIEEKVKIVVNQVMINVTSKRCCYKTIKDFYACINENSWFKYFMKKKHCRSMSGENWIDFESEISKVIQQIRVIRNILAENKGKELTSAEYSAANELFECMDAAEIFPSIKSKNPNEKVYGLDFFGSQVFKSVNDVDRILNILLNDLNEITRALEIYIDAGINGITLSNKDKIKDFKDINPDHVLTFNYSNTYKRLYDHAGKKTYCYIHGEANVKNSIENCELVLGIDEFLCGKSKDRELEYLPFKKFYQRIYKSPDNKYLDWVDEIKDGYKKYINRQKNLDVLLDKSYSDGSLLNNICVPKNLQDMAMEECPKHKVYIFGHSLDVTDKDILKLFICNDNVETEIYYYRRNKDDKESLGKIIKNLIKIMGQKELIRRTGGTHKTIKFIPQEI